MKAIMLSTVVTFVTITATAQAEPMTLTEKGLDKVSAGASIPCDYIDLGNYVDLVDVEITVDGQHANNQFRKVSSEAIRASVITQQ
ncbi:MAG: hypothetical protein J5I81_03445 [Nitrococcus mobilis]|nr:hypothetical protein [Nitrococcus mobilis]